MSSDEINLVRTRQRLPRAPARKQASERASERLFSGRRTSAQRVWGARKVCALHLSAQVKHSANDWIETLKANAKGRDSTRKHCERLETNLIRNRKLKWTTLRVPSMRKCLIRFIIYS